jgi:hypothetical protein
MLRDGDVYLEQDRCFIKSGIHPGYRVANVVLNRNVLHGARDRGAYLDIAQTSAADARQAH